jgi:hypothetical protein
LLAFSFCNTNLLAQGCSLCTKTASQLGEGPAKGLNTAIIYLMLTPLAIGGIIGYRWWKREKEINA